MQVDELKAKVRNGAISAELYQAPAPCSSVHELYPSKSGHCYEIDCAAQKQYKPDMQAYKKLRDQYTPPEDVFGHIPGVRVGEEFGGRGELAILGLHKRILQGIDGRCVTG